jgi:membrane-bound serine protease (ClpP class)
MKTLHTTKTQLSVFWMGLRRVLLSGLFLSGLLMQTPLEAGHIEWAKIDDAITPVTAKYIGDAVRHAEKSGAECLIIEMDTPGGLMQATWTIDKILLASKVPVIVYVSPSGGRAASAGVFISYAADLVAMAPSTNIGSAHPVSMGKQDTSQVMMEKVVNDAVAHIKGLADQRGRSIEWAEEAIRESVNITEKEALEKGVINLIARDSRELLDQLHGIIIPRNDGDLTLQTRGAEIRNFPMHWQYKILDKISNPNIAYLLMLAGMAGIFFELRSPGAIFPGAIGAISLILAFFALQVLPINAAGILLILLAIVFFILEVQITSYGLLTIGGLITMTLGSLMLFRTPEFRVSLTIIIPAVLCTAAFFVVALGLGMRAQMKKATTGQKGLIGETGTVIRPPAPEGQVAVHGEIWKAVCKEKLKKGDPVKVTAVEGMVLTVEPLEN